MYALPLLAGAAVFGLIAAASGTARGGAAVEPPDDAGYEDLVALMDAAAVPEDWQVFFAATAYRESGWNNDVGLGPNDAPGRPPWLQTSRASAALQDNEAEAACITYDRNVDQWFRDSPFPRSRYCFGSGGWFGMLPVNGIISGFKSTPELIPTIDPWAVTDPIVGFVMAVGFARGLMNWEQFRRGGGTWLALRIGWGSPGNMANTASSPKIRESFAEHLGVLGVDASFMDRAVPELMIPRGGNLLSLLEAREAEAAFELALALEYQEVA